MLKWPYYPFHKTDAGRSNSKRPKQKNDCTVRALATAASMQYDDAYNALKSRGRKASAGFHFPKKPGDEVNGFTFKWKPFPAVAGQNRMNVKDFCRQYPSGTFVLRVSKHVFTVVNGTAYDTCMVDPERCVYGVWSVEKI